MILEAVLVVTFAVANRLFNEYPLCKQGAVLQSSAQEYIPAITTKHSLGGQCRLSDFHKIRELGAGNSGSVHLAIHKPTGLNVAIKQVLSMNPKRFESLRREECIQHHLNGSPWTIQHYCTMVEGDYTYFVMEYRKSYRELRPMLRDGKGASKLSDRTLKSIALNLVEAAAHILEQGVTYRDLKSANVLVSGSSIALIDFGMARWETKSQGRLMDSSDIDWFLLGVHIFELASRGKVYSEVLGKGRGNKWKKLLHSFSCPKYIESQACDLIRQLVTKNSKFYQLRSLPERKRFILQQPYFG